jgi:hypothetical protein
VWWRHVPAGADVDYEPPDPADNRWQLWRWPAFRRRRGDTDYALDLSGIVRLDRATVVFLGLA